MATTGMSASGAATCGRSRILRPPSALAPLLPPRPDLHCSTLSAVSSSLTLLAPSPQAPPRAGARWQV
eukprot:CAMPEP_0185512950 /NCGR_PEP_ID=MMETSP1366-20130426/55356_1 /TAXON_ID=38817 /ORGANISM="Gephyrocapsa oceanica, Strain RCC1303" /LENGTH=67 /DNA_ID=CAMNT_0028123621 /DNA_START=13 /DNA_END=213 /DNA_ORIENTATION=+